MFGATFCGMCGARIVNDAVVNIQTNVETDTNSNWLVKNADLAKKHKIAWISQFYGDYAIAGVKTEKEVNNSDVLLVKQSFNEIYNELELEIICVEKHSGLYYNWKNIVRKKQMFCFEIFENQKEICTAFDICYRPTEKNESLVFFFMLNSTGKVILKDCKPHSKIFGDEYFHLSNKWLVHYDSATYPYTHTLLDLENNTEVLSGLYAVAPYYSWDRNNKYFLFQTHAAQHFVKNSHTVDEKYPYGIVVISTGKLLIGDVDVNYSIYEVCDIEDKQKWESGEKQNFDYTEYILKFNRCAEFADTYSVFLLNNVGEQLVEFDGLYKHTAFMSIYKQHLFVFLYENVVNADDYMEDTIRIFELDCNDGYRIVQRNTQVGDDIDIYGYPIITAKNDDKS